MQTVKQHQAVAKNNIIKNLVLFDPGGVGGVERVE